MPYLPYFPPHISPGPLRQTLLPHLSIVQPYRQLVGRDASARPSEQTGGSGEQWLPVGSQMAAKRAATARVQTTVSAILRTVVAGILCDTNPAAVIAWRRWGPAGGGGQQMRAGMATVVAAVLTVAAVLVVVMMMAATTAAMLRGRATTRGGTPTLLLLLRPAGETVHSRGGRNGADITAVLAAHKISSRFSGPSFF